MRIPKSVIIVSARWIVQLTLRDDYDRTKLRIAVELVYIEQKEAGEIELEPANWNMQFDILDGNYQCIYLFCSTHHHQRKLT